MRSAQLLRLVAVGLMLSTALSLPAAEPVRTPATPPAPAAADTVSLADLLAGAPAPADDSLFQAGGWSCPFYTQICSTDSQCDAYCGGVGWGECISFGGARKCCACNT
jgi:hypothetical protein